jgi:Flp pilus assembly pilin Flp
MVTVMVIRSWFHRLTTDESGGASVEYGVLAAAIAGGMTVASFLLGDSVAALYDYAFEPIDAHL